MSKRNATLFTLVLAVLLAGCGAPPAGVNPRVPQVQPDPDPEPVDVGVLSYDLTWTDGDRERDVPVRVYTPATAAGDVAHPLVVFSHGLGEARESFGYLGQHWAEQGFVVVFITHIGHDSAAIEDALRDGNLSGLGDPAKISERPEDMSFVIDRVHAGDVEPLLASGTLDLERLAVVGQCAGSSTALALAGMTLQMVDGSVGSFRDRRAKAVIALGPQPPSGSLEQYYMPDSWSHVEVPALMVTGSRDFNWIADVRANPSQVRAPFAALPDGDKHLVDLIGGEHNAFTDSDPWYPVGERNPLHHGWIESVTTDFLRAYLDADDAALNTLRAHNLEAEADGAVRQALPETDGLYVPATAGLAVSVADAVVLHDDVRDRDVPMRITFPQVGGPYPILFLSHAVGGSREQYVRYVTEVVASGYVVIQPDHMDSPLAEGLAPGAEALGAWRERPRDVTFILDSFAELVIEVPALAGKLDEERVGAAGHYIGAGTANLLLGTKTFSADPDALPETFTDERVDLSLAFSPAGIGQGLTAESWSDITKPMLVMTGSKDASGRTGNSPVWRTDPFQLSAVGDKQLVWIEDLESSYGRLASRVPSLAETEVADWVLSTSLAFLDANLKSTAGAAAYLASDELSWASLKHVTLSAR